MLNSIRKAQRVAIESLYEGKCNIITVQEVLNEETNITEKKEVILAENEPCRVSYDKSTIMNDDPNAEFSKQIITLFIRPELDIPAGSKVIVNQHNKTNIYKSSSIMMTHGSHQEIILEYADKYGVIYD